MMPLALYNHFNLTLCRDYGEPHFFCFITRFKLKASLVYELQVIYKKTENLHRFIISHVKRILMNL